MTFSITTSGQNTDQTSGKCRNKNSKNKNSDERSSCRTDGGKKSFGARQQTILHVSSDVYKTALLVRLACMCTKVYAVCTYEYIPSYVHGTDIHFPYAQTTTQPVSSVCCCWFLKLTSTYFLRKKTRTEKSYFWKVLNLLLLTPS